MKRDELPDASFYLLGSVFPTETANTLFHASSVVDYHANKQFNSNILEAMGIGFSTRTKALSNYGYYYGWRNSCVADFFWTGECNFAIAFVWH